MHDNRTTEMVDVGWSTRGLVTARRRKVNDAKKAEASKRRKAQRASRKKNRANPS